MVEKEIENKVEKQAGKKKRSMVCNKSGKIVEEELTYDRFEKELSLGVLEFYFIYRNNTIDIAYHFEGDKKVFELNINGYTDNPIYHTFDSPQALLKDGKIDQKSFKEIWSELETN